MTIISDQNKERQRFLDKIVSSSVEKKIIVAGPGTGKTFTFGKILENFPNGKNLVMTFIRKLVTEMERELGNLAEVYTFHKYCKKVLHDRIGGFQLSPLLTKIIEDDVRILNLKYFNFDSKFQVIDEESEEIDFYLKRSDYYEVVSFNDSVFRLYTIIKNDSTVIDDYDIILIDEYQDFNPLEVALINELSKNNSIVIVGDDDQAVYSGRNSSPKFLRESYNSGEYKIFELPFCSRCPKVIVESVNSFIKNAKEFGGFKERIDRKFEPFLEGKEYENKTYPKIIKARLTTGTILPKYLIREINNIPKKEIDESHNEDHAYPTVLIIGQRHYLELIERKLKTIYSNVVRTTSKEIEINPVEVYSFFTQFRKSNFSWRLLIELYYDDSDKKEIIDRTFGGDSFVSLLSSDFVETQNKICDLLLEYKQNEEISVESSTYLENELKSNFSNIIKSLSRQNEASDDAIDSLSPSILLTSFEGSKGLSAGHVFIVGANNTSIPKIKNGEFDDIEYSKFIVALTRTRMCCHIISNKWLISPKNSDGSWAETFDESIFTSFIPKEFIEDRGELKSDDL